MTKRKPKAYDVVDATSVRVSNDPDNPDYDAWIHYEPGNRVTSWPPHTDVAGWVESGHWTPVEQEEED